MALMIYDKRDVVVVIIPITVLVTVIMMKLIPIAIVSPKIIVCAREHKEAAIPPTCFCGMWV